MASAAAVMSGSSVRIGIMAGIAALGGSVVYAGYFSVWFLLPAAGVMLCAAGASLLNDWYDRDIDPLMMRTQGRPLASGRVTAGETVLAGMLCIIFGALLAAFGSLLCMLAALAGAALYLLVYTPLKRRTPYAAEIGGFSGAMPPVAGWFAVGSDVSVELLALFLLLFLWQPPHFWALGERRREEYRRAGIPVLPLLFSSRYVRVRGVLYSYLMVLTSLMPFLLGGAGVGYLLTVSAAGMLYAGAATAGVFLEGGLVRTLFAGSVAYLTVVFAAFIFLL